MRAGAASPDPCGAGTARAVVAERDAGPEPWELELAAGLYKLEDEDTRSVLIDHGSEAVTHVEL